MPMRPHKRYGGIQKFHGPWTLQDAIWRREAQLALDELDYGSKAKAKNILRALLV